MDIVTKIILAFAVVLPSAIVGFGFWWMERRIAKREDKREKEMEERELAREKCQLYLIKSVQASLALGEATAKAVQRIPDAKCNGDMHAALDYAQKVKHEQKDFLSEQALKHLY